ncbi:hypothetical protein Tco_0735388 [Tanacetum coccineum]
MDLETAQTNATAKLPILKQGEYEMWRLRIEQYFQVQDYALWDVIENGNSFKPTVRARVQTAYIIHNEKRKEERNKEERNSEKEIERGKEKESKKKIEEGEEEKKERKKKERKRKERKRKEKKERKGDRKKRMKKEKK